VDNAELLKQLRIDREQREDAPRTRLRWPWIAAMGLVVALLLGGALWWWLGQRAIDVRTAVAQAPSADSQAGAVLQATGYITARRQATVSAQITGTLTEV
jgi:multidrug efflux pump subunit AcrA (membrane-fusion protein)